MPELKTVSNLPANLSPKVAAFLAAIGGPGIVLLVLGLVLGDDQLRAAGIALLAGSVVGGGAGYAAPAAKVVKVDKDKP